MSTRFLRAVFSSHRRHQQHYQCSDALGSTRLRVNAKRCRQCALHEENLVVPTLSVRAARSRLCYVRGARPRVFDVDIHDFMLWRTNFVTVKHLDSRKRLRGRSFHSSGWVREPADAVCYTAIPKVNKPLLVWAHANYQVCACCNRLMPSLYRADKESAPLPFSQRRCSYPRARPTA